VAATPQRAPPEVENMVPECVQCPAVGRHCVVGEVAGDDPVQPSPLFRDRLMHAPLQLLLDLLELRPHAAQHERSRAWLEAVLSRPDLVRFAWLTLRTFLRIATNPRVFDRPLSASEAEAAISS
jgi:hypothetical protein